MSFDLNSLNFITRLALPAELSSTWMLTYLSAPLGGEFYAELRCCPDEAEPALLAACGVGERPALRQYVPDPHERQLLLKTMAAEDGGHRTLHLLPWNAKQRIALDGEVAPRARLTQVLFDFVERSFLTPTLLQEALDCSEDRAARLLRSWVQEGLAEGPRPLFREHRPLMECRLGGYELWRRDGASFPWVKAADILVQAPLHYRRTTAYVAEEKDYGCGIRAVVECLEGHRPAEATSAMYPLVPSLFLVNRNAGEHSEIPF